MEVDPKLDVVSLTQALEVDGPPKTLKEPSVQKDSTILENNLDSFLIEDVAENCVELALKKYPTCKGDVELLDNAISAWKDQNSDNDLMRKEIKQLKELNDSNEKKAEGRIKDLEEIIEHMHKNIDMFHEGLNLTDSLNRDLSDLKVKYADLEEKIRAKSDDCIKIQEEYAISINNLNKEHAKEMEYIKAESETKLRTMENEYKLRNNRLLEEIEKLNEKVTKIEREKKSELSVLKMEYESKVAKLQLKRSAAPQQQQSSVLNQDIFRKKLQNLKLEYEQENNSLKNQIRSLQQQLSQKSFGRKSCSK